jgi:hypothetical protein
VGRFIGSSFSNVHFPYPTTFVISIKIVRIPKFKENQPPTTESIAEDPLI